MKEIWAYVAEKDGRFMGCCAPERTLSSRWLRSMEKAGAKVGVVSSREEFNAWHDSLKKEPLPTPRRRTSKQEKFRL